MSSSSPVSSTAALGALRTNAREKEPPDHNGVLLQACFHLCACKITPQAVRMLLLHPWASQAPPLASLRQRSRRPHPASAGAPALMRGYIAAMRALHARIYGQPQQQRQRRAAVHRAQLVSSWLTGRAQGMFSAGAGMERRLTRAARANFSRACMPGCAGP